MNVEATLLLLCIGVSGDASNFLLVVSFENERSFVQSLNKHRSEIKEKCHSRDFVSVFVFDTFKMTEEKIESTQVEDRLKEKMRPHYESALKSNKLPFAISCVTLA